MFLKKQVILIAVLIISFSLIFTFSYLFSTETLFKNNIINPIPQSITDIKYHKNKSAMHGAMIFSFSANSNDTEEIIEINSLSEYDKMPDIISYLIDDRFNNIEWWKSLAELEKMKIYGKLIENEYNWNALFVFTDNTNTKYIIKCN